MWAESVVVCVCVCENERERQDWAGGGEEGVCDSTTKWNQEGILSCSCVPISPPGNICFIPVTKATHFKPHGENKVLLCYYW